MPSGHRNNKRTRKPPTLLAPERLATQPVVVVASSSTELTRWAAALRSHHSQAVGVTMPHARNQGIQPVAAALLTALGKRPDLSTLKRPSEHLVAAWLLHGAASDVVLMDAHKLSGWLLPELITWFCGMGVRPWLVYTTVEDPPHSTSTELTAAAAAVAESWSAEVINEHTMRNRFPSGGPVAVDDGDIGSGLPRLPRCDGIVFRSKCKQLLEPEQFKQVDRRFVAAVKEVRAAVAAALDEPDRHKSRPLAKAVRGHLETARDTEEIVLTARAIQVACLTAGWSVSVDPIHLVAAAETRPRKGRNATAASWKRLDEYREPDYGAAAALHLAGTDIAEIVALRIGDIVIDGDRATHANNTAIDPEGGQFVAVLATYRRLVGADDSDRMFATHRKATISAQHAGRLLAAPAVEQGVEISDRSFGRGQPTDVEWLARYGIRLEHLGNISSRSA